MLIIEHNGEDIRIGVSDGAKEWFINHAKGLADEKKIEQAEWDLMIDGLPALWEALLVKFCERIVESNPPWKRIREGTSWYNMEAVCKACPLKVTFALSKKKQKGIVFVTEQEIKELTDEDV